MTLDDRAGNDLDPPWEGIVVVFNATPTRQTQTVPTLAGEAYAPAPGAGRRRRRVVKTATYNPATGAFTVPARTVAVFVAVT